MEIIRGRLSTKDFSPPTLRYNSGTDTVQFTPDNGSTWVDDPADDPRHSPKFTKPLQTGVDAKCKAAASMVKWLRDFVEYEAGILTAGAEIVAVANAAFALFDIIAPWAVLIQLVVDAAGTLFGIGGTALTAAFAGTEWDDLLCIFDCVIAEDGSVDVDALNLILTKINANLNTTAAIVLNLILQTQGEIGLTNAGTLYDVAGADCTSCDCEWCYLFDFTTTDGGFTAPTLAGFNYGHWVSGTGWVSDAPTSGEALYLTLTGLTIPHLTYFESHTDFNFTCGSGPGSGNYADVRLSGSIVHAVNTPFSSPGGDHVITFTGDYNIDEILFNPSGTLSPCVLILTSLKLKGTGDNPFGMDNC